MNAQAGHRVVVIGGGFGGLQACKSLRHAPVEVTLVDKRNFHLFQPLLYQVATGGLSPADIASPLRGVLRTQRNTSVWLAEATGFDVTGRRVILDDGAIPYDTLVVAAGARYQYFGHDDWARHAPALKSVEDALDMRQRILGSFEAAERESDPAVRRAILTFVIVGGGPTGVELAGALGEIAHDTLRHDFRSSDPRTARILLVEGADRVLPGYVASLSGKASRDLERLGVEVLTGTMVTDLDERSVTLRGQAGEEKIATRVVLWAAGIEASPLARALAAATGCECDGSGRVNVEPDLTVPGHPEIFVIGDLAHARGADGQELPGVAPVAMQQGDHVAQSIAGRLRGETAAAFRYRDRGSMATIGRASAVADLGWLRLWGLPAWVLWLFVHLMYLVEFENRVLVLVQWAWNYVTWNRGARLITGQPDHGGSHTSTQPGRAAPGSNGSGTQEDDGGAGPSTGPGRAVA